jgi:hypothetical protein
MPPSRNPLTQHTHPQTANPPIKPWLPQAEEEEEEGAAAPHTQTHTHTQSARSVTSLAPTVSHKRKAPTRDELSGFVLLLVTNSCALPMRGNVRRRPHTYIHTHTHTKLRPPSVPLVVVVVVVVAAVRVHIVRTTPTHTHTHTHAVAEGVAASSCQGLSMAILYQGVG